MKCSKCKGIYEDEDLRELKEMGESYSLHPFICPDCYDRFNKLNLEDQFKEAMNGFNRIEKTA